MRNEITSKSLEKLCKKLDITFTIFGNLITFFNSEYEVIVQASVSQEKKGELVFPNTIAKTIDDVRKAILDSI